MALDRASILAVLDRKPIEVKVPEWGGTVWIRPLSSPERSEWESHKMTSVEEGASREKVARAVTAARDLLAVLSICDEKGERLFTVDDIPALSEKNALALERVGMAAMRLNMLRPRDLLDLAKN